MLADVGAGPYSVRMIGVFLAAIGGGIVGGLLVSAAVSITSLFILRPGAAAVDEPGAELAEPGPRP